MTIYARPSAEAPYTLVSVEGDTVKLLHPTDAAWQPAPPEVEGHITQGIAWDPTAYDEITDEEARSIISAWAFADEFAKYNHGHDARGRFSGGGGGGSGHDTSTFSGGASGGKGLQAPEGHEGMVSQADMGKVLKKTPHSHDVPMKRIKPRGEPDPKSVRNARFRMEEAAKGGLEPRKPVTVKRTTEKGYDFEIVDGNGTYHAAQAMGWTHLRVEIEGEGVTVGKAWGQVAKFNPYHGAHGLFAHGPGGGGGGEGAAVPHGTGPEHVISPRYNEYNQGKAKPTKGFETDPTDPKNLPAAVRQKMEAVLKEHVGTTPAAMVKNLEALYARIPESVRSEGMQWYGEAGRIASEMATTHGVERTTAVGVIAALSPQHDWDVNVAAANYLMHVTKHNVAVPHMDLQAKTTMTVKRKGVPTEITVTLEQKLRKEVEGRGGKRGKFVDPNGKNINQLSPEMAASVIKWMGRNGHYTEGRTAPGVGEPLRGTAVKFDSSGRRKKPAIVAWSCGMGSAAGAVRVMRENSMEHVTRNLNGHKVRSFYNNILLGEHTKNPFVTIDTHAVSAAANRKMAATDPALKQGFAGQPKSLANGVSGTYPLVAQAYRTVAARHGLDPHQFQAMAWLQWREEHKNVRKPRAKPAVA